jgi:hypothetical protein
MPTELMSIRVPTRGLGLDSEHDVLDALERAMLV